MQPTSHLCILGLPNECPGVDFQREDEYDTIMEATTEAENGVCAPNDIEPTINETALTNMMKNLKPPPTDACSMTRSRDVARTEVKLITTDARKRSMQGSDYTKFSWDKTSDFNPNWIKQIQTHQGNLLPIAEIQKNMNWLVQSLWQPSLKKV